MAAKRQTLYKTEYSLEFGVKVCERDAVLNVIVSASCLFSIHFGREEQIGAKQSCTVNIMYFNKPLRADTYRRHMVSHHPGRWKEYSELTPTEKTVFFDDNAHVIHRNTIKSHFFGAQVPLHLFVNKPIVDVIIREMLFHLNDSNDEITKEHALNIFEDVINRLEANAIADDDNDFVADRYRIDLKNPAQFNLIADYLSVSASFRMTSRILMMTKERTGLTSIGSTSEGKVTSYAHFICALNLQTLLELLSQVWTFLIAMDMSTHMATSYLDIRIRLH